MDNFKINGGSRCLFAIIRFPNARNYTKQLTALRPFALQLFLVCVLTYPIALLRHTTLISYFLNVQQGRISSRGSKRSGSKDGDASSRNSNSPIHSSPLQNELSQKTQSMTPNLNISPGNANTQAPGPMNIKRSDSIGSVGSQGNDGVGGNVNKGSIGHGTIGVGGISNGGIMGGGTAVPASLGGRTTMESQPVHARSLGFNEGGISGITNIEEGGEGSGTSSMRVGSGG